MGIAEKADSLEASVTVRARTLARTQPRTEREDDGADLEAARVAAGCSYREVARALKADESLVRHIRDGLSTLSWSKIKKLPRAMRIALLTAELTRAEDETPTSVAPLLVQATRATASSTRLAETIVDAEADAVLTGDELDAIEHDALAGERAHLLVRLSARAMRRTGR